MFKWLVPREVSSLKGFWGPFDGAKSRKTSRGSMDLGDTRGNRNSAAKFWIKNLSNNAARWG